MNSTTSSDSGFTLLESMIALLVLATGLLGMAHLFALAIHQASYARNNTMLVSVAMDQMEQIRQNITRS